MASLVRTLVLGTLCALALAGNAAMANDGKACPILSFAPLDRTIPACDRLIASGELGEKALKRLEADR
jgi:hypothetical protein